MNINVPSYSQPSIQIEDVHPMASKKQLPTTHILNTDSEFAANLHFAKLALECKEADQELLRESLECILSYIVAVNK